MRKSRSSEGQIISILAEQERGEQPSETCRRNGISSAMFYKRKVKFGGMDGETDRLQKNSAAERRPQAEDA